jgi:hypothetical protein
MQNKIHPDSHGPDALFKINALRFVLMWSVNGKIPVSWIYQVNSCAAMPEFFVGHWVEAAKGKNETPAQRALNAKAMGLGVEPLPTNWKFYPSVLVGNFPRDYVFNPDLFAALLNRLRNEWRKLEKSKAGKLKKFIALHSSVRWPKECGKKRTGPPGVASFHDLQDAEIIQVFESSPGGSKVSKDEVRKARQWVAKHQREAIEFEREHVDKDGFIHIKGKSRRK